MHYALYYSNKSLVVNKNVYCVKMYCYVIDVKLVYIYKALLLWDLDSLTENRQSYQRLPIFEDCL